MKLSANIIFVLSIMLFFTLTFSVSASEKLKAEQTFKKKCAFCHAMDKKKLGPAIKAMSNDAKSLRDIISKGKKSMPSFDGKLTDAEINALVDYLLANQ